MRMSLRAHQPEVHYPSVTLAFSSEDCYTVVHRNSIRVQFPHRSVGDVAQSPYAQVMLVRVAEVATWQSVEEDLTEQ